MFWNREVRMRRYLGMNEVEECIYTDEMSTDSTQAVKNDMIKQKESQTSIRSTINAPHPLQRILCIEP